MNEAYLQYIWKLKRVPVNNLYTTDGKKITVLNFGTHNLDSGPDFFNGQVEIDAIKWSGNIEIHVKSSEWYLHKHQKDKAYNNVVLHVVYEYDKEVIVNGEEIPTIELKRYIDTDHFNLYNQLLSNNDWIPCVQHIPYDDLAVFQQMTTALIERGKRKAQELQGYYLEGNKDLTHVLHLTLFSAFGGRVNKESFLQLANTIPYSIIQKEVWDKTRIEALLFGSAGFLDNHFQHPYQDSLIKEWTFLKHKYQLTSMHLSIWKFGGIRPSSFPTLKIAQLSQFISKWQYRFNGNQETTIELIRAFRIYLVSEENEFWETHYTFKKRAKKKHKLALSLSAQNSIFINGIVPYLWFLGEVKNDTHYIQKALDILEQLAPELNNVNLNWKKIGVFSKNAADSQSLLEQKNQFCNFRRCLECKIGYKILSK
ncbi:MAG: DUF2851 family protein [Lishizhenia sp.]